jgi:hypothetical protein
MRRTLLYLVVSMLMVAGEPAIGATLDLPRGSPAIGTNLLAAPIHWIVSIFRSRFEPQPPSIEGTSLLRSEGWGEPVFQLNDHGYAVLLEIQGGVELDRATILLADGSRLDLDLAGARRGDGLFALADFNGDRAVLAVGLRARARSQEARVGVRLLRPAPTEAAMTNTET